MFTHAGQHPGARKTKDENILLLIGRPGADRRARRLPLFHGGGNLNAEEINDLWVSLAHTSPLILSPPAAVCHRCATSGESGVPSGAPTHPLTHSPIALNHPHPPQHPDVSRSQPISCPGNCCRRENAQTPSLS